MSVQQYPAAGSGVTGLDMDPSDTFISVFEDVWQALKGNSALFAYMALKRHVHAGQTSWFATRKVLAEEAGMGINTFDKAVKHLVSLGLVVVQHRFVPAGWKGDVSQIVFERSKDAPQQIGSLFHVRFHLPKSTPSTPTQNLGHPLPNKSDTPSHILGNRHITHDIDPKRGGEVEAQVQGSSTDNTPPPSLPSVDDPAAADAAPPAPAGATPDTWCTPDHPRCREHAHIPPGDEVPPCHQCGNVRSWFTEQARNAAEDRRARIAACHMCDDRGMVPTTDTAGRPVAAVCDHQTVPAPVDGPEPHRVVSDPSVRRRALLTARSRGTGQRQAS